MREPKFELNPLQDPLLPGRFHRLAPAALNPAPNWHENTEIVFCVSGAGYVKINDRTIPLDRGDLIVINSEMFHSVHSVDPTKPMQYLCLTLDRNFCQASGVPSTALTFEEKIRDSRLSATFLSIYEALDEYQRCDEYYRAVSIRAKTLEFLYLLCRDHWIREGYEKASHRSEIVRNAMIYMKQNLSSKMTLDGIAQHVGISKNHLSREFKKVSGQTVFSILLQLRCDHAKRLIEQGYSVAAAAHAGGFDNLSYFTRVFRRYYGEKPSSYLKK